MGSLGIIHFDSNFLLLLIVKSDKPILIVLIDNINNPLKMSFHLGIALYFYVSFIDIVPIVIDTQVILAQHQYTEVIRQRPHVGPMGSVCFLHCCYRAQNQ